MYWTKEFKKKKILLCLKYEKQALPYSRSPFQIEYLFERVGTGKR